MLSMHMTFKAFESSLLSSVQKTVESVSAHFQTKSAQPKLQTVRLPTTKKLFTVLRSPHVHKKAREQFVMQVYKKQIRIPSSSSMFAKHHIFLLANMYLVHIHKSNKQFGILLSYGLHIFWTVHKNKCERWDLNPHAYMHYPLKIARLPNFATFA